MCPSAFCPKSLRHVYLDALKLRLLYHFVHNAPLTSHSSKNTIQNKKSGINLFVSRYLWDSIAESRMDFDSVKMFLRWMCVTSNILDVEDWMCIVDTNMAMSRILVSEGNGKAFLSGPCVDIDSVSFSYRQLPHLLVQLHIIGTASFLGTVVYLANHPVYLIPKYFSVYVSVFSRLSYCPSRSCPWTCAKTCIDTFMLKWGLFETPLWHDHILFHPLTEHGI